jgi:translocation protein SEC62
MPKLLQLAPQQAFDPAAHYAWFYDGSPLWTIIGGIAMVAVMLAGVMFPLWPVKLRIGVWYLSVAALGFVGAFIVLAIVRLIFWCFTKIFMAKAIWMFPNLFEDVGFVSSERGELAYGHSIRASSPLLTHQVDSFIPLWAWDEPKKKKLRKVGEKRHKSKGDKAIKAAPPAAALSAAAPGSGPTPAQAAAEAAAAPAPAAAGAESAASPSAATSALPAAPQLRHRQAATVEEVDDE